MIDLPDDCLHAIGGFASFYFFAWMLRLCHRENLLNDTYRAIADTMILRQWSSIPLCYDSHSFLQGYSRTPREVRLDMISRWEDENSDLWEILFLGDVAIHGRLDFHHRLATQNIPIVDVMDVLSYTDVRLYMKCFRLRRFPFREAVLFLSPNELDLILDRMQSRMLFPYWKHLYRELFSYSWTSSFGSH